MSDDGYTLAEALAALAILGLAIGGLGLVVSLIARQQLTVLRIHDRLADARAADRAVNDLTADADLKGLAGDAGGLSFPCGAAICAATLRPAGRRTLLILRDASGASRRLRLREPDVRFAYLGARGTVDAWPQPAPVGQAAIVEPPRAILLRTRETAVPLAVTRSWRREPRDCQFDAIAGGCRTATP